MNKIPIVFTFDDRIILGASVAIKSLLNSANAETSYDICVLHDGIPQKYLNALSDIVPPPHSIQFKLIDKSVFKGVKKNRKSWTEIVYYRMIIPEVLRDFDKAIYSDVDVFFKDDLTEAFNTDISDFHWAGVRAEKNAPDAIGHKYFPENKNEFIYWSGFMLINCRKCRDEKFFEKCMKTAFDFRDRLKFFDLDVLNISSDKIAPMPLKYCVLESLYALENLDDCADYEYLKKVYSDAELASAKKFPSIIHHAGQLGKPWHRKNPPSYYREVLNSLPKTLKKRTLRDLRKMLFSKL